MKPCRDQSRQTEGGKRKLYLSHSFSIISLSLSLISSSLFATSQLSFSLALIVYLFLLPVIPHTSHLLPLSFLMTFSLLLFDSLSRFCFRANPSRSLSLAIPLSLVSSTIAGERGLIIQEQAKSSSTAQPNANSFNQ